MRRQIHSKIVTLALYLTSFLLVALWISIVWEVFTVATVPHCSETADSSNCHVIGSEGPSSEYWHLKSKTNYIGLLIFFNLLVTATLYALWSKKLRRLSLIIPCFIVITGLTQLPEIAQASRSKLSIVDLVLDAPSHLLEIRRDSVNQFLTGVDLSSSIKAIDRRNGYLELEHKDVISKYVFAKFSLAGGSNLLCVVENAESVQSFRVLKRDSKGLWTNVTHKVLPEVSHDFLKEQYFKVYPKQQKKLSTLLSTYGGSLVEYRLPRNGTTILAISAIDVDEFFGRELFSFKFKTDKFYIDVSSQEAVK